MTEYENERVRRFRRTYNPASITVNEYEQFNATPDGGSSPDDPATGKITWADFFSRLDGGTSTTGTTSVDAGGTNTDAGGTNTTDTASTSVSAGTTPTDTAATTSVGTGTTSTGTGTVSTDTGTTSTETASGSVGATGTQETNLPAISRTGARPNPKKRIGTDQSVNPGIRNNNPLNIRKTTIKWQGKINSIYNTSSYEAFESMPLGIRAALINMQTQIRRIKQNGGEGTVEELIKIWAPKEDNNNPNNYANIVASKGVPRKWKVDFNNKDMMCRLVWAMSGVENGFNQAVGLDDIEAGYNMFINR